MIMTIMLIVIIIVELRTNARQYYNPRHDGDCFHLSSHATTKIKSPAPVTWSYFSTRKWLARTGFFGNIRRLDIWISRNPPHRILTHDFERTYGDASVGASGERRWPRRFKDRDNDIDDQKSKGRQRTFSYLYLIYIFLYCMSG